MYKGKGLNGIMEEICASFIRWQSYRSLISLHVARELLKEVILKQNYIFLQTDFQRDQTLVNLFSGLGVFR